MNFIESDSQKKYEFYGVQSTKDINRISFDVGGNELMELILSFIFTRSYVGPWKIEKKKKKKPMIHRFQYLILE